jgi:TfoX/Sxy family transcriptional regulator of competence genes
MEWKKPSQELIKFLVDRMEPFSAQKKAMFGSTVYFANGYMFIGVHEDHIFLRLPEDGRKELRDSFEGVTQFEPMKGRPMREYMIVPPRLYECTAEFSPWIKRSMDYVMSLPPKAPKTKKK